MVGVYLASLSVVVVLGIAPAAPAHILTTTTHPLSSWGYVFEVFPAAIIKNRYHRLTASSGIVGTTIFVSMQFKVFPSP